MQYKIKKTAYGMNDSDIFTVGKRSGNPKRTFLFISRLLGKHIPVNPETVRTAGFMLSSLKYNADGQAYADSIKSGIKPTYREIAEDNVLVIGFCETATGLGMAVASSIKGCTYISTTREKISDVRQLLSFEERHSHITTHKIFSNDIRLDSFKKVILVDDEITTGQSLFNLMEQIEDISHMDEYSIMTLLDWRRPYHKHKFSDFERKYNTPVSVYSLASGDIIATDSEILENENLKVLQGNAKERRLGIFPRIDILDGCGNPAPYMMHSGRFGISGNCFKEIEINSELVATQIVSMLGIKHTDKVLVLGHGEDIYIPSRISAYIQEMTGGFVLFKTTTRSPIYCDGSVIKDAAVFFDRGERYYFYNAFEADGYDYTIMLLDAGKIPKLCNNYKAFYI